MTNQIQIGIYKLEKEEVFRKQYETAAWYQDVKVQPGEYPVFGQFNYEDLSPKMSPGKIKDTSIYSHLKGAVVKSDFSTLYGGVPISSKIDKDKGKITEHLLHPYAHHIALAILQGKSTRYQLNDDFHARYTTYIYQGMLSRFAGIFQKSTDYAWQVQQFVEDEIVILYAYKPNNNSQISVLSYWDNDYSVGTFNSDTKQLTVVEKFPLSEDDSTFYDARELYLNL